MIPTDASFLFLCNHYSLQTSTLRVQNLVICKDQTSPKKQIATFLAVLQSHNHLMYPQLAYYSSFKEKKEARAARFDTLR